MLSAERHASRAKNNDSGSDSATIGLDSAALTDVECSLTQDLILQEVLLISMGLLAE